MVIERLHSAACLAACLVLCGGCGSFRCGGPSCGEGCAKKSHYAFMKYDCSCDSCGGPSCGCGDKVGCGVGCTAGCDGSCSKCGGKGGACGCGKCGDGACGKQTPCRLLNAFCTCAGCGERYWNEWYNDPPSCCEPCDCNGNWIGPGHGAYYRAPYIHGGYAAGKHPAVSPLELADEEPADATSADESPVDVSADSIETSEAAVNAAATAAAYDDADLAEGLK